MSYHYLAKFYDFFIKDEPIKLYADFIKSAIKKYYPDAKTILELGSGTGNILISLSRQFKTFGIDSSKEMVEIARGKDKKTIYHLQDMRKFNLSHKFDVIISMFDTINHLVKPEEWRVVFSKAFEHLKNGGLFIFDLNTQYKLKEIAKNEFFVTKDHEQNIIILRKVFKKNILRWQFEIFVKQRGTLYKLYKEEIEETAIPLNEVKKLLVGQNFTILSMSEIDGSPVGTKSRRALFVCQRPQEN